MKTNYNHEEGDLHVSLGITEDISNWMLDVYLDALADGEGAFISILVERFEKEFSKLEGEKKDKVFRYILAEAVGHIDKRARDGLGVGANLQ